MDTIKVVCGIIFNEEKILICRRKPTKSFGGYWEFPGGKIEKGESEELSLIRELKEELGIKVENITYFKSNIHDHGSFIIELIAYKCRFIKTAFKLADHDLTEWINIQELDKWNLSPADIPIAKELMYDQHEKT
jgi:8-oxo-dGTP diphosphatase